MALLGALCALAPRSASASEHDVLVLVDNSGSMRKNDPQGLAKAAVGEFIDRLDDRTRVGMVVFDSGPKLVVRLASMTTEGRQAIQSGLDQVNYRGPLTNTPSAVERALYHLRMRGREDARLSIVLLTDGKVDVGDPARDKDMERWLREELAQSAAEQDIRIFGIAFSEEADFRLLQALSQRTGGEYLRVLDPEQLSSAFDRLAEALVRPHELPAAGVENLGDDEPAPENEPESEPSAASASAGEPSDGERQDAPRQDADPAPEQERSGSEPATVFDKVEPYLPWAGAAGLVVLLGLAALVMLRSQRAAGGGQEAVYPVREAVLIDTTGITKEQQHPLDGNPLMVGRKDDGERPTIVVEHNKTSRRHALITYENGNYWVTDQGTRNGTFVNAQRIDKHRLQHCDVVRFGAMEFEFRLLDMDEDDEEEATAFMDASQLDEEDDEITVLADADLGRQMNASSNNKD